MGSAEDLAREVMEERVQFQDIDYPDRVRVQNIAVQAGQGPIADRDNDGSGAPTAQSSCGAAFWSASCAPLRRAGL
jgi:hypothetical protein